MTRDQENFFTMLLTVQKLLESFPTEWNGLPGFVQSSQALDSLIASLHEAESRRNLTAKGSTTDKRTAKVNLARAAAAIAQRIMAFAGATGNQTLREQVHYTFSKLLQSRDAVLTDKVQIIEDHATTHLAALADYGVDSARLSSLANLKALYAAALARNRVAEGGIHHSIGDLDSLLRQANEVLKTQIDPLVRGMETDRPEFSTRYFHARTIIDRR